MRLAVDRHLPTQRGRQGRGIVDDQQIAGPEDLHELAERRVAYFRASLVDEQQADQLPHFGWMGGRAHRCTSLCSRSTILAAIVRPTSLGSASVERSAFGSASACICVSI